MHHALAERFEEAVEHGPPVVAAEVLIGEPFRVRHQPEDGAGLVQHAGDVVEGAVRVGAVSPLFAALAVLVHVAEGDAVLVPEPGKGVGIRQVVAVLTPYGGLDSGVARPGE